MYIIKVSQRCDESGPVEATQGPNANTKYNVPLALRVVEEVAEPSAVVVARQKEEQVLRELERRGELPPNLLGWVVWVVGLLGE